MTKKFWLSVVAVFLVSMVTDGLIHAAMLKADYVALGPMYRGDEDQAGYMAYMLLAHVLLSVGFVWIYLKGREEQPWVMQGLRFGAAVALLATIPGYLVYYAVQPLPGMLVAKQIVFSVVGVLLMGLTVAAINKKG
ncbi:MAG TPA: hypothetical protein VIT92_07115 [Burkholderiaceae bacterium]